MVVVPHIAERLVKIVPVSDRLREEASLVVECSRVLHKHSIRVLVRLAQEDALLRKASRMGNLRLHVDCRVREPLM